MEKLLKAETQGKRVCGCGGVWGKNEKKLKSWETKAEN